MRSLTVMLIGLLATKNKACAKTTRSPKRFLIATLFAILNEVPLDI